MRENYDSLLLKLQEGLESYEQYSEKPYRPLLSKLRLSAGSAARHQINANTFRQHTDALLEAHPTIIS